MEKYTIQANDSNPLLLTIAVDHSSSTTQKFPDGKTTAEVIASSTNEAIEEIQAMCLSKDKIKDKIFLHVISYGAKVESLLCDPIGSIIPIRKYSEQQDYDGILLDVEKSVFIEPVSSGRTPMNKAFNIIHDHIEEAYNNNPGAPASVVINISDGMPNNKQLSAQSADSIQQLSVDDGNTLLFNAHVDYTGKDPIFFPVSEDELPDEYSKFMFQISSELPPSYIEYSNESSNDLPTIQAGAKAMIYNASGAELLKLIQLGTRAGN